MVVCIATYGSYEWYVRGDVCRLHTLAVPGVAHAIHHHSATSTWAYAMRRALQQIPDPELPVVLLRAEDRLPHDLLEWIK